MLKNSTALNAAHMDANAEPSWIVRLVIFNHVGNAADVVDITMAVIKVMAVKSSANVKDKHATKYTVLA